MGQQDRQEDRMTDPIRLASTGETDETRAAALRTEATAHLTKVIEVMNRAKAQGLTLDLHIQRDTHGNAFLQGVYITKHL